MKPTAKYGGRFVTIWGFMVAIDAGSLVSINGIMYKKRYEKIFVKNVKQSTKKLKTRCFIFQQDNDPKHTAGKASKVNGLPIIKSTS